MLLGALCVRGWWRNPIRRALSVRIRHPEPPGASLSRDADCSGTPSDGEHHTGWTNGDDTESPIRRVNAMAHDTPRAPRDAATHRHPQALGCSD
jgi:hypothetical protein